MSSSFPAATICSVISRSSGLGVGSPEGWLWTTIRAALFQANAALKTSPTRIMAVLTEPTYTVVIAWTRFLVSGSAVPERDRHARRPNGEGGGVRCRAPAPRAMPEPVWVHWFGVAVVWVVRW